MLGMCEGGDAALVYGGEVGEEHVYTACLAVRLLRGTLDMDYWCVLLEEWRCRF